MTQYLITIKTLVEMWVIRSILMRSQMEMKNILLKTRVGALRRGENPSYKVTKTKQNCELCSYASVLWKVEFASDKIGYLAEEIYKQSVKRAAWFLLTANW